MIQPRQILLLATLLVGVITGLQAQPPFTPTQPVIDEYYGQKITDPYRWMENLKSEPMQQWMRAQADYSRATLDQLPRRDSLLKRLVALNASRIGTGRVKRLGERLYFWRRLPTEQIGKWLMRDLAAGSSERVLFDLDKRSSEQHKNYRIGALLPSPDGRLVAYELYEGGKEIGETRVLDIATGTDLTIRIGQGAAPQSWLPSSQGFTYTRMEDSLRPEERNYKRRVRLHLLGSDSAGRSDRALFGYGVNTNLDFPLVNQYAVTIPAGSAWAFGWVNPGPNNNYGLYYAPVNALVESSPVPWRKLADLTDEIVPSSFGELALALKDDDLYVMTTKNKPLGEIIRFNLKDPNLSHAQSIFSDRTGAVTNVRSARDALYVQTTEGGMMKLWRVDYHTRKAQPLPVPMGGSLYELNADTEHDGLLFGTDSWVNSERYLRYNPIRQNFVDTQLAGILIQVADAEVVRVQTKSHDGTMVPLVIVHKKGIKLDGSHPTLLMGYGAYGTNGLEPSFQMTNVPWVENGGVLALAGVRGGGEYGEAWRLGGFQTTKPNTWKDFIACAEYLIQKRYTAPSHLAGRGSSAGGILINNAIVERPDLFAAAVVEVGVSNTLRFEMTANGAANIAEFGSVSTEAGFRSLLAMDAYHKVKSGVNYPAMLFCHGANDTRVEPWLSTKMAARLQAATTSDKPVLLRINYDAGHKGGSTLTQNLEEAADRLAFLFEQLK